ncbi:MAG: hypothetical protein E6Z78_02395 [Veillonella sp.]|jgi:hypothetical protein|nr:hypothetical protein [Veillonella sp.]
MNICIVVDKIGDNICEEVSSMCDKRGFIYGYDALRNILVAQKNNNI